MTFYIKNLVGWPIIGPMALGPLSLKPVIGGFANYIKVIGLLSSPIKTFMKFEEILPTVV